MPSIFIFSFSISKEISLSPSGLDLNFINLSIDNDSKEVLCEQNYKFALQLLMKGKPHDTNK